MAERLKGKLLEDEKVIDLVAGPDAYRDLPRLISAVQVTLATSTPHNDHLF
jgi:tRNA-2-methylthio-N6-dimethylallyladenosine synthase